MIEQERSVVGCKCNKIMKTQKKEFEKGGISPEAIEQYLGDPERIEARKRYEKIKNGDYSFLGYIKPKQPKETFMEKLKALIALMWIIFSSLFVGLIAFVVVIITYILLLAPIWIPCLTLYLIFK